MGMLPGGRMSTGSFGILRLEGFYFSHACGNIMGGLRGGFQTMHQFSRCALSGAWSLLIGWRGVGGGDGGH